MPFKIKAKYDDGLVFLIGRSFDQKTEADSEAKYLRDNRCSLSKKTKYSVVPVDANGKEIK